MKPQQKDSRLTIGQRIDVFKVLTDGGYHGNVFAIGTWRVGNILSDLVECVTNRNNVFGTLPMEINREVKRVGCLVVTKLKGEDGV